MGFSLNAGRTVAEPLLIAINGERSLASAQLKFTVEWSFNASVRVWGRIYDTFGVAYVRVVRAEPSQRISLGHVWPELSWAEETTEQERKTSLIYRLFA